MEVQRATMYALTALLCAQTALTEVLGCPTSLNDNTSQAR